MYNRIPRSPFSLFVFIISSTLVCFLLCRSIHSYHANVALYVVRNSLLSGAYRFFSCHSIIQFVSVPTLHNISSSTYALKLLSFLPHSPFFVQSISRMRTSWPSVRHKMTVFPTVDTSAPTPSKEPPIPSPTCNTFCLGHFSL